MLPSGNDAAMALAETLGEFLCDCEEKSSEASVKCFVREMNKFAKQLELHYTRYLNPHGMNPGNMSTVGDCNRLARYILAEPKLMAICNATVHTSKIQCGIGFRRQTWKNTNKLLSKGYGGIKTGTTVKAGACLVAYHPEGNYLVTVLNSSSSDQRWRDVERLVKWSGGFI